MPKQLTELQSWQGKYDAYLSRVMRGDTPQTYSHHIQEFLDQNPKLTKPRQFDRTNFADYCAYLRAQKVGNATFKVQCTAVRGFWEFMLRRGAVETQIARTPSEHRPYRLTVEGLKKAWARIADDPLLQDHVVELYDGRVWRAGRHSCAILMRFKRHVSWKLEIPWLTPHRFVRNFKRLKPLGMELVHSRTFPMEPPKRIHPRQLKLVFDILDNCREK